MPARPPRSALARRRGPLLALLAVAGLAGCGGDDADRAAAPTAPAPAAGPLALPTGVPIRASGEADAGEARVIRGWANALRRGDVVRAASFWALPATVQNGTPVLRLASTTDLELFNGSLACGAIVTATGGAPDGYTIVTVRLTERPGGDCGSGAGNSARTAIRVRGAKIVGWYRLPDDPDAPAPQGEPGGPIV